MNFTIKEFPTALLENYGVSKTAQNVAFNYEEMHKLLSGQRTDLIKLQLEKNGVEKQIEGVFSLKRNADNTVSLLVLKKEAEISTKYKLSDTEKRLLNKNEIIKVTIGGEAYLSQLDVQTNQVLRIKESKMIIPDFIQNVQLSLDQKRLLRDGQSILLKTNARALTVKLNLNEKTGFAMKSDEIKLHQQREEKVGKIFSR